MGETRVDLVHLLEDLRDAYPGSLEETILTEIVANALDSGARTLAFLTDTAAATLTALDDGKGMTKRELSRYHDLATTSKKRGSGIGFAGVGIKLGLLACEEVITETRRGSTHAATEWRLANRSRAPWSWIDPPGLVDAGGTAVSLRLSNPLSPLLDPGFIEATLLRNFQPLFEPEFLDILAAPYPEGLTMEIDGRPVVGPIRSGARVPVSVRIGRQRKPSAVGYLARHEEPLPESDRGIAISTLGKVILRGWDWLALSPTEGDRIEGLIEVPPLAEALTLNKGDFLRTGSRGALFLAYRKTIQEIVAAQLAQWGAAPEPQRPSPRTRPLERDLHRVLGELADDFPLLATIADQRAGGQRRLPLGRPTAPDPELWGSGPPLHAEPPAPPPSGNGTPGPSPSEPGAAPAAASPPPPHPAPAPDQSTLPGARRRKSRTRLSLEIRFESVPDDDRLGRIIDSIVWVNDAHPAYRRARSSRAEGYHLALTVASALAPLAVEPARAQDFIHAFLARWGAVAAAPRGATKGDSRG